MYSFIIIIISVPFMYVFKSMCRTIDTLLTYVQLIVQYIIIVWLVKNRLCTSWKWLQETRCRPNGA